MRKTAQGDEFGIRELFVERQQSRPLVEQRRCEHDHPQSRGSPPEQPGSIESHPVAPVDNVLVTLYGAAKWWLWWEGFRELFPLTDSSRRLAAFRIAAVDLQEVPMRRGPAGTRVAIPFLVAFTLSLWMVSTSTAATHYKALSYRVVEHRSSYVVARGHHRTLVVRNRCRYLRGRDGRRYRVIQRNSRYVVLREVSSIYGCTKPVTTRTVRGLYIRGGTHDVTYSHVTFAGHSGSSPDSWTCVGIDLNGRQGSIRNITFDHCVFSTLPAGYDGDGVHMWNTSTTGKTITHITFRNCWFEPQPRMVIEMNGRGGWWHDVTIDHCTVEPGGGEMLSFDMANSAGRMAEPYGVTVDGVARGVEGLHITDNDFRGTGVTVNGYTSSYTMGFEFSCIYPDASDPSVGRSYFTGNRVGRCDSSWFQCNRNGAEGMTFADNVFNSGYNPGGVAANASPAWSGTYINHCTFTNNTYILDHSGVDDHPWELMLSGLSGDGNTFSCEQWTKTAGSIGLVDFPFTNSTYTDCQFHLPASHGTESGRTSARFPASASGTGCVFDHGHTGGTFN